MSLFRTAAQSRVVGIDVARCLALLGMMATHILPGYVDDQVPWWQQLAGGRASALFAVLAGVSLALMSGRQEPVRGRARASLSAGLAVRAVLIAVLGLALGELDSGVAVILTYYGLLFLLGLPFLGLRAAALFMLAGVWLVVVPVFSHLLRPHLPPRGFDNPMLGSLANPGQLLSELLFTGYYPNVPWLAYLLVGMAIGRVDLRRASTAVWLLAVGTVTALASTVASRLLTSRADATSALRSTYDPDFVPSPAELDAILQHGLFGATPTGSWWWITVVSPHTATPFDLAQTIGSTLAVTGLCLLLTRAVPRVWAVAFGAGAMTLTLYSTHVVMLTENIWPAEGSGAYRTHVLVVLGVGAAFGLLQLKGPLEAVVALLAGGTTRALGGRGSPVSR